MSGQRLDDFAAITAFLAMAVKMRLILNGRTAQEVFDAHMRLHGVPPARTPEILCKMLGDEPTA